MKDQADSGPWSPEGQDTIFCTSTSILKDTNGQPKFGKRFSKEETKKQKIKKKV